MLKRSRIVEEFPLTIRNVMEDYTKLPIDGSDILYHYTTRAGLEGILKSGGLRATYRMQMNDRGEFEYARDIIYQELDQLTRRNDLPKYVRSIGEFTRKNLKKHLKNSAEYSASYCACLTVSSDHPDQWANYAENGTGFAIGFAFGQFLNMQYPNIQNGQPFVYSSPVMYDEDKQRDLLWRLVEAGNSDLQRFFKEQPWQQEIFTMLRNRVTEIIALRLLTLIDFIKAPAYRGEREIRLMLDCNDGTLKTSNVQHYGRNGESIPYLFIDMLNPITKRLPLSEIRIGPKASFSDELSYVERLLDDLEYGSGGYADRPRISHSKLS